jgi:fructose-1,6-bisphosphatase-3
MATFERYFIDDKAPHQEYYTPYFKNLNNKLMAEKIFEEFGINKNGGHIICGHVPVKAIKGENPIKADGMIICIDAGFSKAYRKETGVAGCTLTFNSYGLTLVIHEPFESIEKAVRFGDDIKSEHRFVESVPKRMLIEDTDTGKMLKEQIYYLEMLLYGYKTGFIKSRHK